MDPAMKGPGQTVFTGLCMPDGIKEQGMEPVVRRAGQTGVHRTMPAGVCVYNQSQGIFSAAASLPAAVSVQKGLQQLGMEVGSWHRAVEGQLIDLRHKVSDRCVAGPTRHILGLTWPKPVSIEGRKKLQVQVCGLLLARESMGEPGFPAGSQSSASRLRQALCHCNQKRMPAPQ